MSQLAQFSFFNNLSPNEQDKIRDVMQTYSLAAGEQLITEGENSDSFYLLLNGEVEVYVSNDSGEHFTLSRLGDGSHFGELSFLDGDRRSASIKTISDCNFLVLERDDFKSVMKQFPSLYETMIQSLVKMVRQQNETIRELAMSDTYRKISKFLNQSRSEMGSFRKAPPKMTADLIAKKTDTSKEIVVRLLNRLENLKHLTLIEGAVTLHRVLPEKL